MLFFCLTGSSGGASGGGFQGGFISGANGAGAGFFSHGGPLVNPGGDPTKQQQHSHQSMTPGGSCLPLDHCATCPNKAAKGFRGPNGCYFCYCGGSHSSGTGRSRER